MHVLNYCFYLLLFILFSRMIIAIRGLMYTVQEILALEKMVIKNNRCTRIEVSSGFRGTGSTKNYHGSGPSCYSSYLLADLDGKEPLYIDDIVFGNNAHMHIDLLVKADIDDIMYCVNHGQVIVGKVFEFHEGIAHDTEGSVRVEVY